MASVRPSRAKALLLITATVGVAASGTVLSQSAPPKDEVTFSRDIAPILQRSCQSCHRPDGAGPMPLLTYEDVRPYARAIKTKTGLGPHAGVMPPWFVEKNIGIQKFKSDPSLSDEEIAKIAKWADGGAPRGNPADMPKAIDWSNNEDRWLLGQPDLVVKSQEITVPAHAPDRWGSQGRMLTGLTEDRYVKSVEVREINNIPKGQTNTVGGRYVWHHQTYSSVVSGETSVDAENIAAAGARGGTSWPIHEVGRNADLFPDDAGRLLAANSILDLSAAHIHANGHETKAHLEFGFRFFPKGYQPKYRRSSLQLGNGNDLDVKPNTPNQEIHAYATLQENTKIIAFEPHLHAPGVRMCLEAIWGMNIQQLSCVGYDHNWVKQYLYEDDAAPLLPKGTIVHLIGFLDTSAANKNPADPRNWAGGGRRSIANMFIDLGYSVALSDEQFQAEMAKRRTNMRTRNDYDIGCPLCWAPPTLPVPALPSTGQQGGNQ